MSFQTRDSMVSDGEHVVQFYDQEADLVDAVGDYLVASLNGGPMNDSPTGSPDT